jgi:membrane protease YdiL (CAAX protease family)
MCILAPAVEEGIYRVGLCCGTVGLLRPGGAIAASGLLFGALHVLYGNPGPDNLVAGFFLAWAFLKSGSILVPLALHAAGNLCVLASWIALWYAD